MTLNIPVGGGGADVVVVPPGEENETRLEHRTMYRKVWVGIES